MRRRLTVAIVLMVAGTLLLTTAGSLLLIHRAATRTAQHELLGEARAAVRVLVSPLESGSSATTLPLSGSTQAQRRALRRRIRRDLQRDLVEIGHYRDLGFVTVGPSGQVSGSLPDVLDAADIEPAQLRAGHAVSGAVGDVVYAAVPVPDASGPLRTLVLVVTRDVASPVNGLGYFLLVSAAVLIVAALVAAYLARRISTPLVRAVATTRRIADGDLEAKVPVAPGDDPELRELGEAINAMGESLERARGLERQFLMSVSHELRTPLTSIRGYADAVMDGTTDDVGMAVTVIASEARRLERLVRDLLDLARLDARQFSFDVARIDCAAIVAATAEGFRPEADAQGLALAVVVPSGAGLWADADPDRVAQIVANLVENAFKYARREVQVGATDAGGRVTMWVLDDGSGIAPEDLPRVFDRHFHSDRAPARRLGSGLGLAIVAELATAMGGAVEAQSPVSSDGRGTRVTVSLPQRPAPTVADDESAEGQPAPSSLPRR